MRAHAVLAVVLTAAVLAATLAGLGSAPARAETVPPPKLYVTVFATESGGTVAFVPNTITIAQIPTVVNVTVKNTDPTAGMSHTFTIRSTAASPPSPYLVNTGLLNPGQQASVEFTIVAADRIVAGNRNETVELDGGLIKFFCIPHEAIPMRGHVVIGSVQQPVQEPAKGVFLRAYWIGLLGIAGTLLLVAISYFVIKTSSRHFTDHHEHIRRGGP